MSLVFSVYFVYGTQMKISPIYFVYGAQMTELPVISHGRVTLIDVKIPLNGLLYHLSFISHVSWNYSFSSCATTSFSHVTSNWNSTAKSPKYLIFYMSYKRRFTSRFGSSSHKVRWINCSWNQKTKTEKTFWDKLQRHFLTINVIQKTWHL